MCPCLCSQCSSTDLLLSSFCAITIEACLMPNIEFYFPSPGLSALLELLLWCREQQPAVTCCPATPAFCTGHRSGARALWLLLD